MPNQMTNYKFKNHIEFTNLDKNIMKSCKETYKYSSREGKIKLCCVEQALGNQLKKILIIGQACDWEKDRMVKICEHDLAYAAAVIEAYKEINKGEYQDEYPDENIYD